MHRTLFLSLLTLTLSGCGGQATADRQEDSPAAPEPASGAAQPAAGPESKPASPAIPAAETAAPSAAADPDADQPAAPPATVAEAARVLDLATFPLLPGVDNVPRRTVAGLSYQAPENVKAAYDFQRRNLIERQFQELPNPQVTDQYASGQFTCDGFHVSVSVTPGQEGKVAVFLQNHSNVNLPKLPVPPGAKLQYAFPGVASFITDAAVEETAAAVRQLLLDQGWQPYGTAGDTLNFKQNAVELGARVFSPPAQPGKTTISYSALQLSADLPAPADAESVHYADSNTQLSLDVRQSPAELAAYYQTALAPSGWKATTENPIQDRTQYTMIFRNPAKEMLTLEMRDLTTENKTRALLKFQTAAEVEEENRRFEAALAARKKKEEEERNKPKPKALVAIPAGASEVSADAREIEFKLPTGTSKPALDALTKQFQTAGWKAEDPVGGKEAGVLTFTKDGHSITIHYVDPGFIPAEITISAMGVELERQ